MVYLTKKSFFFQVVQIILSKPSLQKARIIFYFLDYFFLLWIRKPIYNNSKKKKVIITFPLSLGDVVIFLNTIEHISIVFDKKEYEVTLACQKEYAELFKDYFENVIALDYQKSCVNLFSRIKMLREIRRNYYDIAIDPIGCEECSQNVFFMNAVCAKRKIGALSATDKEIQCPAWIRKKIYGDIIYNPIKNLHKVKFYTYFWSKYSEKKFKPTLIQFPYQCKTRVKHYFILYPSASAKVKMWDVKNYAEIARRIYQKTKYTLMLCGTERDLKTVNNLIEELDGDVPFIYKVGQTNIKEFIGLIGGADLVITNDTSVYHIAVMQKRRTCVITGGYVYDTFINYQCDEYGFPNPEIVCPPKDCVNCYNKCIYKVKSTYPCVSENKIEDVWKAVERLLMVES